MGVRPAPADERASIERWFASHNTSPNTNAVLTAEGKRLSPNRTLKAAILSFHETKAAQEVQDAVAAAVEAVTAAAADAAAAATGATIATGAAGAAALGEADAAAVGAGGAAGATAATGSGANSNGAG